MRNNYFLLGFLIIILSVFYYLSFSTFTYSIILLVTNIWLVIKYRSNRPLILFLGFQLWVNYSIIILQNDLIKESYNGIYSSLNHTIYSGQGFSILTVYWLSILAFTFFIKSNNKYTTVSNKTINSQLSLLLLFFYIAINLLFLLDFELLSKSFYEYSLILLIMSFYYARVGTYQLCMIIIIIGTVMGLANFFILGDRIVGLQVVFAIYFMYFYDRLSKKTIIITLFLGVIYLVYLGGKRENYTPFSFDDISVVLPFLFDRLFTMDTAYSAFFTSLRSLEFLTTINTFERVELLFHFIFSVILGPIYPYYWSQGNLALYTFNQGYTHSYGSILPLTIYFYTGLYGVIGFGYVIAKIIKSITDYSYIYNVFYYSSTIYIISSSPRWTLYSALPLIKGIGYIFIITAIIFILKKYLIKIHD